VIKGCSLGYKQSGLVKHEVLSTITLELYAVVGQLVQASLDAGYYDHSYICSVSQLDLKNS
jgi:hypothetical protein